MLQAYEKKKKPEVSMFLPSPLKNKKFVLDD